jgi:phosphate transport system protein
MEKFHNKLADLKNEVLEMGKYASEILTESMETLKTLDTDRATEVHGKKDLLMKMETQLEEKTLRLLTLFQPMASDLRTLAAIFNTIVHLNRIGRYGKDIANIVRRELDGKQHIKKLVTLSSMIQNVESMVSDVLKAFNENDITILEGFSERDDIVDAQRQEVFRECLTYMMEDQRNIPQCIAYIMTSRYLERCGDHACRIAEKVIYMVNGEIVDIR